MEGETQEKRGRKNRKNTESLHSTGLAQTFLHIIASFDESVFALQGKGIFCITQESGEKTHGPSPQIPELRYHNMEVVSPVFLLASSSERKVKIPPGWYGR
jgi:hypothetical protein